MSFEAIKQWNWFPESTWKDVFGGDGVPGALHVHSEAKVSGKLHHMVGLVAFLAELRVRDREAGLLDNALWEKVASWLTMARDGVMQERGATIRVSRLPPRSLDCGLSSTPLVCLWCVCFRSERPNNALRRWRKLIASRGSRLTSMVPRY